MAYNPINLCTVSIVALGTTAIAAHQFPKRWRQYAVNMLPGFVGRKVEAMANLKRPLWQLSFAGSTFGLVGGGVGVSYILLAEESTRALTFITVLVAKILDFTLPRVLSPEKIPSMKFFEKSWGYSHQVLDGFSGVRKSALILAIVSAVVLVALVTFGRIHRLSLAAFFPPKSDPSRLTPPRLRTSSQS